MDTQNKLEIFMYIACCLPLCFILMLDAVIGEHDNLENQTVIATVIEKDSEKAQTWHALGHQSLGWKSYRFPDTHYVVIEYKGIVLTYDNKSLYNKYEVGDEIKLYVDAKFDSAGNFIPYNHYEIYLSEYPDIDYIQIDY